MRLNSWANDNTGEFVGDNAAVSRAGQPFNKTLTQSPNLEQNLDSETTSSVLFWVMDERQNPIAYLTLVHSR
jgi:hypothetical protein